MKNNIQDTVIFNIIYKTANHGAATMAKRLTRVQRVREIWS